MREDRNSKASDVSDPSIWIFILCQRNIPKVTMRKPKEYTESYKAKVTTLDHQKQQRKTLNKRMEGRNYRIKCQWSNNDDKKNNIGSSWRFFTCTNVQWALERQHVTRFHILDDLRAKKIPTAEEPATLPKFASDQVNNSHTLIIIQFPCHRAFQWPIKSNIMYS